MRRIPLIVGLCVTALSAFYLTCLHYTEVGQVGIQRNLLTGEVNTDKSGWSLTAPWVQVAHVETRPMRVCISTSGRGYSCKLVQFEPDHYAEFVNTEGFHYYWWANRFSYNSGYERSEEYRGFRDLMRGHAYGAKQYSFITILETYEDELPP